MFFTNSFVTLSEIFHILSCFSLAAIIACSEESRAGLGSGSGGGGTHFPPALKRFTEHLNILIRMAVEKQIAVGLLLLAFIGLTALAMQFIKEPQASEGFETLITRAADCQCLPGYIPSKTSTFGGSIYTDNISTFWYFFKPNNENALYRITENNSCGIPHIYDDSRADKNLGNYPIIPKGSQFQYKSNLNCGMIEKTSSSSYFCQSLSDASKTKKCY